MMKLLNKTDEFIKILTLFHKPMILSQLINLLRRTDEFEKILTLFRLKWAKDES